MKLLNFFLPFVFLIFFLQTGFAQNSEEDQLVANWMNKYTGYNEQYLYQRYDLYSKDDVVKFKEKFELLNNVKSGDVWDGIYSSDFGGEVSFSQLRLNSRAGFISFYIYTCLPELRALNFGKIVNSPDTIQLIPEFGKDSPRKSNPVTYVKIKWNDRNYLVEESSVAAFGEKIVGIYVEPEETSSENYQRWNNYVVSGDLEKPLTGLPEFPTSYKKFQRAPIEAKIISVGRRTVEEKTLGNTSYSEAAFYSVIIDAGKNKGVKIGMTFEIPEIENEVFITQVNQKTSVGLIHRDITENKTDSCRDDNYAEISCPKIKNSLKIKTSIAKFWY